MKTMAFDSNYSNGTTIYSSHGIKRFLKDPLSRERIRVRGSKSAVVAPRSIPLISMGNGIEIDGDKSGT